LVLALIFTTKPTKHAQSNPPFFSGTHDLALFNTFIASLRAGGPTPIPQYDKSAYSGLGDRLPPSTWPTTTTPPQVLILEGWCVGFRPLPPSDLEAAWRSPGSRTLHRHKLEHLQYVNSHLAEYDGCINALLDAFVHVDAERTEYVYAWRAEQEAQLRRESGGRGMTEEQVVKFVDAYYPAYELYTDGVRTGIFGGDAAKRGCQLRLVVGRDRRVTESVVI
jgi:D-glycerate 3-kinase